MVAAVISLFAMRIGYAHITLEWPSADYRPPSVVAAVT